MLKKNVTAAVYRYVVAFIFKIVHYIPAKCQVTMVTGCGRCAVGSDGHCCPAGTDVVISDDHYH